MNYQKFGSTNHVRNDAYLMPPVKQPIISRVPNSEKQWLNTKLEEAPETGCSLYPGPRVQTLFPVRTTALTSLVNEGIEESEREQVRLPTPECKGVRTLRFLWDQTGLPDVVVPEGIKDEDGVELPEDFDDQFDISTDELADKMEKLLLLAPDSYNFEYPFNSIYMDPTKEIQDDEEFQRKFQCYEYTYEEPSETSSKRQDEDHQGFTRAIQSNSNNPGSKSKQIPIHDPYNESALPRKRNELLLNIWTDSGPFSKIEAMTIACSIMETGYDEKAMEMPLDMQRRDEFTQFCSNLNLELGLQKTGLLSATVPAITQIHYRILWRVYGIFINAIKTDDIIPSPGIPTNQAPVVSEEKAKQGSRKKAKKSAPEPIMGQREEFIFRYNPIMINVLSNPLKNFIVTFARFTELGKTNECPHLRPNQLTAHALSYQMSFLYALPPIFIKLPLHMEAQLLRLPANIIKVNEPLSFLDKKVFNAENNIDEDSVELNIQSRPPEEIRVIKKVPLPSDHKNGSQIVQTSEQSSSSTVTETEDGAGMQEEVKDIAKDHIKKRPKKYMCVLNCRYDIVKRIAAEKNFKFVADKEHWNIVWSDGPLPDDKLEEITADMDKRLNSMIIDEVNNNKPLSIPLQKLNHFPGMSEVCRKDRLALNLRKMKSFFPKDYDFFPETWTLPNDMSDLFYHARIKKNCTYICKPDTGCQGKGIFLVRDLKLMSTFTKLICQLYIPRPFLIDGYKFDLRIYALVTCCNPLRIYLYNEGIARFATVKYDMPNDTNINSIFMHLTNFSLNKFSETYTPEKTKRKMSEIYQRLKKEGHNVQMIIRQIDSIVVKTLIAAQLPLKHFYKTSFPTEEDVGSMCFELLGIDILLDENLKPYLLEVNHSPSFNLDLPVDEDIKQDLIFDTFSKIYLGRASDKENRGKKIAESPAFKFKMKDHTGSIVTPTLQKQFRHEQLHGTNFRLIYPDPENAVQYSKFLAQATAESWVESIKEEQGPISAAGNSGAGGKVL